MLAHSLTPGMAMNYLMGVTLAVRASGDLLGLGG